MTTQTATATTEQLEQRILDGGKVTPEELAAAEAREAGASRIAALTAQREEAEALAERKRRALQAAAPVHEQAARLVGKTQIAAAIDAINRAVKQWFDAVGLYNKEVDELRRAASSVREIEPTAPTGITIHENFLSVNDHIFEPFDGGDVAVMHHFQQAVIAAKTGQ